MASLTGQKIKDTYQSLLKTDDNGLVTTVFKNITDGSGSVSGLYLKNDAILVSGSLITNGDLNITGSLTVNGIEIVSGSTVKVPFSYNQTNGTDTIRQYQSIFNPTNLKILENNTFIIEENAEYYVLGDLYNSGSLIVSGTLIIGGVLYNSGSITGPGIII